MGPFPAKPEGMTLVHFTIRLLCHVILSAAKNPSTALTCACGTGSGRTGLSETLHFVQGDNSGVPISCSPV